jgi:hypothetical protein
MTLAEFLWGIAIPAASVAAILRILRRKKKKTSFDWLDDVLFTWQDGSPFTARHTMQSIHAYGITGSGKSSGSGRFITAAIAKHPRSTFVFLCQKPEDQEDYERILREYNKPYLVFSEGMNSCNLIDTAMKAGADARQLVEMLMVLGQSLDGGQERTSDPFWKKSEERLLYNAISALMIGRGSVTASDLLRFIESAPNKAGDLKDDEWLKGFCPEVIHAAFEKRKPPREQAEYKLMEVYWTREYPNMDDRPRSSVMAGVMNILHVFNTGLVQEKCAAETTFTPQAIEDGVSIIVNFPSSQYGPTGQFISGGIKFLIQKHIWKWARKSDPPGGNLGA